MTSPFRQSFKHKDWRSVLGAPILALCLAILSLIALPSKSLAQASSFSLPDIPVLTIKRERLFTETQFGQNLSAEIAVRGRRLSAENRRIEQELADEESELTELRKTLNPKEFRVLAGAFDIKVTTARSEQDTKARGLSQLTDQVERRFLFTIAPAIEGLMREKGASVILDRRAVFASADETDITQEAIGRIDSALGQGMPLDELLAPAPASEKDATQDQ